jgi:hypothetical protein
MHLSERVDTSSPPLEGASPTPDHRQGTVRKAPPTAATAANRRPVELCDATPVFTAENTTTTTTTAATGGSAGVVAIGGDDGEVLLLITPDLESVVLGMWGEWVTKRPYTNRHLSTLRDGDGKPWVNRLEYDCDTDTMSWNGAAVRVGGHTLAAARDSKRAEEQRASETEFAETAAALYASAAIPSNFHPKHGACRHTPFALQNRAHAYQIPTLENNVFTFGTNSPVDCVALVRAFPKRSADLHGIGTKWDADTIHTCVRVALLASPPTTPLTPSETALVEWLVYSLISGIYNRKYEPSSDDARMLSAVVPIEAFQSPEILEEIRAMPVYTRTSYGARFSTSNLDTFTAAQKRLRADVNTLRAYYTETPNSAFAYTYPEAVWSTFPNI